MRSVRQAGDTKTPRSRRRLAIAGRVVDALADHRAALDPHNSPLEGDAGGAPVRHGQYMRHGEIIQRMEYRVLELRESRIGGALSGDKLEEILNDEARQGWLLKAITHADVKGRVGPGAVEGLILTFERPVS